VFPVVRGGVEPPTFRFQGLAFSQVTPPAWAQRAIRVRYQCFTTIDGGSFAASPCAASSDSAEAISASRPSTGADTDTTP